MQRLGIIFGGRSDEHEISILSASSVVGSIDRSKYEVVTIGINKCGEWYHITDDVSNITALDDERIKNLIPTEGEGRDGAKRINLGEFREIMDFAFPVLHGPFGEDGTIQGMFEMMDIPYAGCGVTASALAMDKIFAKEMWIRAGLPVCKHGVIKEFDVTDGFDEKLKAISDKLGYPLFVKPANMGSSVGISRAQNIDELKDAVHEALKYDSRVIIEEEIIGRELETGVLGNNMVEAATVGEIVAAGQFYDYESKYKDDSTLLYIPADITADTAEKIRHIAVEAFRELDGSGFARVDFFLEEGTGRILLNEVNTIPGFTKYSMFPSLWDKAGVEYKDLIERIINLGYERYNAKNNR